MRHVKHALSTAWRFFLAIVLWRWSSRKQDRRAVEEPEQHERDNAFGPEHPSPFDGVDPRERHVGPAPGAERLLALLLLAVPIAGGCFVALFVAHPNTQLLGLSLGLALALLAAALIVAGRFVVVQETKVEERPALAQPEEIGPTTELIRSGLEGITRRQMIAGSAVAAGVGLTASVAIPMVALGPRIDDDYSRTPWRRGRRLVDQEGTPWQASQIGAGSFETAFPEHSNEEDLGSPIVVVRVDPATLKLPAGREHWAPLGIVAYSKICTHAGCAISLYRSPLNPSTAPGGPALICPCHYSTFDVLDGAQVEFGPAGRALPQLPLMIDDEGYLRAGGPLSGPVGPSWWGDST